jgi:hypothetical protein
LRHFGVPERRFVCEFGFDAEKFDKAVNKAVYQALIS